MKINRHFRPFFILFLTLLSIQTTTAQPGSTDLTFNPGNGANGDVQCVCSQSDNKTIVTGLFNDFNGSIVNYIVRLNEDGTIDGSFNTGSGFGGNGTLFSDVTYSCAIQSDGKILVGGNFFSFNGTSTNRLVRLNSDGTIDASFNIGTGFDGSVRTISIQSDGKIIVGGWLLTANGNSSARLARLNSDGSVDPTFTIGSGFGSLVLTTAIQLDGKILVGGQFTTFNGTSQNYIARLNSNGTIDPSFQVGTAFNNNVRAISIQSDGRILIGGDFTTYNGSTTNRIIRLNSDGSIDETFSAGTGFNNRVYAIEQQTDGQIIVGGQFTTYNGTTRNRIARLNTDGTLDSGFSPTTGFNNVVFTLDMQSDGKIMAGGQFQALNNNSRVRVARLNGTCATLAPTATVAQTFCNSATIANLTATGTAIQWYADASGGTTLAGGTALADGSTYYASQTSGGCESTDRFAVTVTINSPAAPTGSATQEFCNTGTVAELITAGSDIQWYTSSTGGSALGSTVVLTNGIYYASQTISGCESADRFAVAVTINIPTAPAGNTNQNFCGSALVSDIAISGSNITWYDAASAGNVLLPTTALVDGSTYYANQTISGCESLNQLEVTVSVNAIPSAPTGAATQEFCNGATIAELAVTGTALTWYASAVSTAPLSSSTSMSNGTTYFATQTVNGCESSDRLEVTVTINAPVAPSGNPTQTFCSAATVNDLNATGTDVAWYSTATGGTPLASSAALSNGTYYASQTVNGCESSDRLEVAVTINVPVAPSGNPTQTFCFSGTVSDLQANGQNIQWYNPLIGGGTTPLNPGDALVDGFAYQATQTVDGCESHNQFVVTVDIITFSNGVNLNGATLTASATGATYQWIDCDDNNAAINGSTAQTFTPAQNGNYAVVIIVNGCSDTSACVAITTVGLVEDKVEMLNIQPNPTSGMLIITVSEPTNAVVTASNGAIITTLKLEGETVLDATKYATGVYYLRTSEGQTVKFIKQ